jgi:NAD(P)H-hydrate epimerase
MENAGRGAAAWLVDLMKRAAGSDLVWDQSPRPRVLIACGPGNNGGDGGVVARHLNAWGFPVEVVWFTAPTRLKGDALIQYQILERSEVHQTAWDDTNAHDPGQTVLDLLAKADWIVDGLLGTGLTRPVEGHLRAIIKAMNGSCKPVLALDLPSGLDADTGRPLGVAVKAVATATFVAPKRGFSAPGASTYTGHVAPIDIGLPLKLLRPFLE